MGIAATGIITLKDRIRPESSGFPLFSYGGDLGWIAGWFVDRDTIRIGHIGEDGTAIGKPVTIQSTFEQAILSDVSWLSDGGYVVSYYSATQQGGYDSIQTVLQYDSDNKLVAKNTLEAEHPDLLTLESGGYLLMYRSNFNGSNGAYDLTARIYDPLGSMIKDIELGHIDFSKRYYTERLADGFWSATITDTHSASTNTLYDSHGNKITSVHAARNSTVSFNVDGSYEVETFQTENEHGSIRLRTYDASKQLISSKIVGEFDYQNTLYEHSTYLLETGIRLLFWRDEGVDRTHPVHMTIYNSDGSVLKENVILSKSAASIPEIFELSDGGWLARIDSFIYAYSPEGKPYGPAIRSDSWNRIEVTDDGGWIINHREYDIKSGTDSYYSQVFHPNFGKNNAPVTYDFTFTGKEDRAYNFSGRHGILSDDFDGDRIKSLVVDSTPTFGRLMFDGKLVRSGDVIPVNQLASMNWIPEKDAFGDNLASFRFHVIDEHGLASEQTSTITLGLENVSDAPTTRSRSITILEDQTYTLTQDSIRYDDIDGDNLWYIRLKRLDDHGQLFADSKFIKNGIYFDLDEGEETIAYFTPGEDEYGKGYSSLTVKVRDDGNRHSRHGGEDMQVDTSTITFNVIAVNDAPMGEDVMCWVNQGQRYNFIDNYFQFDDIENDHFISIIINRLPKDGILRLGNRELSVGDEVKKGDLTDLNYTAFEKSGGGEKFDQFKFSVRDDGGRKNGGDDIDDDANNFLFRFSNMDVLQGTEGNDRIVAGEGKQILDGGKGNDVLNGGKGDDILIGGSGADVFVMYRSTGNKYYSSNENIADFNVDEDRIDLRMVPEYYSYEFLKEDFTKYGSGTAFQFYDESYNKVSIIIKGVAANDLTEDNFIFA